MRRRGEQPDPAIPEGVSAADLDRAVRAELRILSRELADDVAKHLASVALFIDDDPDRAWRHAVAARRRAARLGVVRETAGLAAYRAGRYPDALSELRTARRLTGSVQHLPVMADAERGLGRPQRALDLARSAEARSLDAAGRVELLIVEAGARQDLGQDEAAVVTLQVRELDSPARTAPVARLRHAYATALAQVGRGAEAEDWFQRARHADRDGSALLGVAGPEGGLAADAAGAFEDDEAAGEIIDLLDGTGDDSTGDDTGGGTRGGTVEGDDDARHG